MKRFDIKKRIGTIFTKTAPTWNTSENSCLDAISIEIESMLKDYKKTIPYDEMEAFMRLHNLSEDKGFSFLTQTERRAYATLYLKHEKLISIFWGKDE